MTGRELKAKVREALLRDERKRALRCDSETDETMTEPLTPEREAEIAYSTKHPHEPEIPPAYDAEGRCLVCGLRAEINRLRGEVERLTKELAEAKLPTVEHVQTIFQLAATNADAEGLYESLRDWKAGVCQVVVDRAVVALRKHEERVKDAMTDLTTERDRRPSGKTH